MKAERNNERRRRITRESLDREFARKLTEYTPADKAAPQMAPAPQLAPDAGRGYAGRDRLNRSAESLARAVLGRRSFMKQGKDAANAGFAALTDHRRKIFDLENERKIASERAATHAATLNDSVLSNELKRFQNEMLQDAHEAHLAGDYESAVRLMQLAGLNVASPAAGRSDAQNAENASKAALNDQNRALVEQRLAYLRLAEQAYKSGDIEAGSRWESLAKAGTSSRPRTSYTLGQTPLQNNLDIPIVGSDGSVSSYNQLTGEVTHRGSLKAPGSPPAPPPEGWPQGLPLPPSQTPPASSGQAVKDRRARERAAQDAERADTAARLKAVRARLNGGSP